MGNGKRVPIKEVETVNTAGIEFHGDDLDLLLWGKDAVELEKVVKIYLKNFSKKIGGLI